MWEEKWAEFEGGWGGEDSKMTILCIPHQFVENKKKASGHDIRPNCCTTPHKFTVRTVCKYIDNIYE